VVSGELAKRGKEIRGRVIRIVSSGLDGSVEEEDGK